MGPGAQFQIVATVGDVYLVSQFDRANLIGRPVIYFVVDAFSRMVTGMSVGLEGPSWNGAMMAITNMAADKVAYCKEYGIKITESEWPCHHVPAALLGDRGEMESKNADNLVNMLGIRFVNAPPYRADLKGIVEQHFRTINTNSVALLPGSVKARSGKTWQIAVSYDPRDMTNIYIWNQNDKNRDTCYLLDWNGKNAGKCLDEIIYEQRKEKLAAQQLKIMETEAKVNLNAEIDSIISEANYT